MPLTGRWRGEKTFCGTVGAGKCILSEKTRRAPELHSGLKLFRVWSRGCSALRRSCCVRMRRRRRGLIIKRTVFAEHHSRRSGGRATARGEASRQGQLADAGMREMGARTRGSVRTANARRKKAETAHDGQSRMMKRGVRCENSGVCRAKDKKKACAC